MKMTIGDAVVQVDDDDMELLLTRSWYIGISKNKPYVRSGKYDGSQTKITYLHRLVSGAQPGQFVRFRNNNSLDCRRENIEVLDSPAKV